MKDQTQLLCTFTTEEAIDEMVDAILGCYALISNRIYVLQNTDQPNQYILTYNVTREQLSCESPPPSTISVHRKKLTNTIYTINAINKLIISRNDGILDKSYKIDWEELQNTILVTAYNNLKVINTKLVEIIAP